MAIFTSRKQIKGFALPTVLITSMVMMTILLVSVSSAATTRVALRSRYFNSIAKTASDAGAAYAQACLRANSGVPLWTNSRPLKPGTDCSGNQLSGFTCPAGASDARCYVMVDTDNNLRSSFSVAGLTLDSNGRATDVISSGYVELVSKTSQIVWRKYNQATRLSANIPKVQVLVVAGGGGGGKGVASRGGSGGGAGGLVYASDFALSAGTYSITVGAGGAAAMIGNDSVFGSITAKGGGRGVGGGPGQSGGSGSGGGAAVAGGPAQTGGAATQGDSGGGIGYGFAGGASYTGNAPFSAGGGGGAGAAGRPGTVTAGGNGGVGRPYNITGSLVYYAGGGGGSASTTSSNFGDVGVGGIGGGGAAATGVGSSGGAGVANTGGGGGGAADNGAGTGGAGGSGVVIIAFPTGSVSISSVTGTYTQTAVGGNTIYKFTAGTGSLVVGSVVINYIAL